MTILTTAGTASNENGALTGVVTLLTGAWLTKLEF